MTDRCPRCEEHAARGSLFCGACGRSLEDIRSTDNIGCGHVREPYPTKPAEKYGFVGIIAGIMCIFIICIAVFEAVTMSLYGFDVFGFLADKTFSFIVIVPFPERIFSLHGGALQAYWIFVIAVILLSVAIAIKKFIESVRSPGNLIKHDAIENTSVFWIAIFMGLMMLVNFVTVLIVTMAGNEPTTPDFGNQLESIFLLADAPVWEEIVARVLYIGVPMAVISLIVTKKKESLKCLFGGFGMSMTAVAFILISAAIFGLAHSPGWDSQAWKVVTSGITGIFLGYVFVRFGLYAAILLHFVVDYLSAFDWMGVGGFTIVVSLSLIAFGLLGAYYILARFMGYAGVDNAIPMFKNGFIKDE